MAEQHGLAPFLFPISRHAPLSDALLLFGDGPEDYQSMTEEDSPRGEPREGAGLSLTPLSISAPVRRRLRAPPLPVRSRQ